MEVVTYIQIILPHVIHVMLNSQMQEDQLIQLVIVLLIRQQITTIQHQLLGSHVTQLVALATDQLILTVSPVIMP